MPKLTKKRTYLYSVSIFFLLSFIAHAQTTVSGYVKGVENKPLENASVTLLPENISVQTDKIGYYQFTEVSVGEHSVQIYAINYFQEEIAFSTQGEKKTELEEVSLEYSPSNVNQGIITLTDDDLEDDESNNQTGISLLQSSRDVFSRAAAFELGGYWFKTRGLDNQYANVMFNGIVMNKQDNGRVTFGNWGGLNDVTRYPVEILEGSRTSQYQFGNLASNTYFETRASSFRKGTRLTYSATNRSYRNRLMFSHFSGMTPSGWAFAISGSRRWAEEGIIDGTYYDAYGYFASIEKKINDKHSINLSGFGAPGRRSSNSPQTQEVYDLMGKNYNSYWGWYEGDKRSQRIKKFHEPQIMLSHYWDINDKTSLKTTLGYQFGTNGASRLDWFNSFNPDPTYYRNLPSYGKFLGYTEENMDFLYNRWQNDESFSQINWDRLYQINANMASQDYGNGAVGKRAAYYLVYDRNDDKTLSANTHLSLEINPSWNLYANLSYQNLESENYREVDDLMGADFALNLDDFNNNSALGPNQIVYEGDKIEYYYTLTRNTFRANLMNAWQIDDRFNVELSAFFGYNESHRFGEWRNDLYGDASEGDSDMAHFVDVGMKAQITYKIDGRNFIRANSTYFTMSPTLDDIFPNPRLNNFITPNLKPRKINSNELSYIHQGPVVKARLTGYYSTIQDDVDITRYYAQGLALAQSSGQQVTSSDAFVAEILTGVDQEYLGAELGLQIKATSDLSFNVAGSYGQFVYANNPNLYLSVDDAVEQGVYDFGESYLKDYKLGNGPQIGGSFGIRYSSPKYWWLGASANYLANSYLDVSPLLRTENFINDPATGHPYYNTELDRYIIEDDVRKILKQQKFEDQFMLNANIGKSFKLGKYYMSISAMVNNLLSNRDYVTGGFEQGRAANFNDLYEDKNREMPIFGPKLWFDRGRTYFVNINFRF